MEDESRCHKMYIFATGINVHHTVFFNLIRSNPSWMFVFEIPKDGPADFDFTHGVEGEDALPFQRCMPSHSWLLDRSIKPFSDDVSPS